MFVISNVKIVFMLLAGRGLKLFINAEICSSTIQYSPCNKALCSDMTFITPLSDTLAVYLPVAASYHKTPALALEICREHFQSELRGETS